MCLYERETIEAWLSLVERCVRDAEVASSNLVASIWPCSQAAKTSPSHGEGPGSIPGKVTSGNHGCCRGFLLFYGTVQPCGPYPVSCPRSSILLRPFIWPAPAFDSARHLARPSCLAGPKHLVRPRCLARLWRLARSSCLAGSRHLARPRYLARLRRLDGSKNVARLRRLAPPNHFAQP